MTRFLGFKPSTAAAAIVHGHQSGFCLSKDNSPCVYQGYKTLASFTCTKIRKSNKFIKSRQSIFYHNMTFFRILPISHTHRHRKYTIDL